MTASLRRAAGSLLVVGLGGMELTGQERAWLSLVRPAGIILFRRNIADARQTRALLNEATGLGAAHGLRCVDVEGGTVDRLRDALAPMPSAQAVARAAHLPTLSTEKENAGPSTSLRSAQDDGAPRLPRSQSRGLGHPEMSGAAFAMEHGELVARAVKAFGFNTTLAPVLDLGLPDSAEVMGTRAAGATAAEVVEYAHGFLSGLAAQGVVGCGKHFPGLGGGTRDSHLETPAIRRSGRELWRDDLAPYRELRGELPMVMVSHAAYPETPGKSQPASVSHYWIERVLRKRIGYRGIAFSDDLEMGGILRFMPMEEAVVAAVRAGMDLLEICHRPELILRAFEALITEGERSRSFAELLMARARRTARLRARLFAGGVAAALSKKQFDALRSRILRFGETIANSQLPAEVKAR
jgi:beta-N-acetylhexosaminidase